MRTAGRVTVPSPCLPPGRLDSNASISRCLELAANLRCKIPYVLQLSSSNGKPTASPMAVPRSPSRADLCCGLSFRQCVSKSYGRFGARRLLIAKTQLRQHTAWSFNRQSLEGGFGGAGVQLRWRSRRRVPHSREAECSVSTSVRYLSSVTAVGGGAAAAAVL